MHSLPLLRTAALVAVLALSAGCQTTVGNYFGNRARDFGECFAAQVGLGVGLGVDIRAVGILHASVGGGFYFDGATLGWAYGAPLPSALRGLSRHAILRFTGFPLSWFPLREWFSLIPTHTSRLGPNEEHYCYFLLPVITDAFLHSDDEISPATWARIHAFDIEVGAFAIVLGARVGFSPGEFLDFLLGWVGIDIAGDDKPLGVLHATPSDEKRPTQEAGE